MKDRTKKVVETVCRLYRAGMSKKEIAEEVLCAESSINHYLRLGGVRQARNAMNDLPQIIELYEQGFTVKEIGEKVGYEKTAIVNALNRAGYQVRRLNDPDLLTESSNLLFVTRKPKTYKLVIDGKRYEDITELCGI
jgi:predicted DNA-binding protein YlxM (UPF0122 family)